VDRRTFQDRRRQPTPVLSRHTFFGQRRNIRRKEDCLKTLYIDRYSAFIFFFIVLTLGLNVLDSLFTIMILDLRGVELNPVVRSAMDLYGHQFWIWKFALVSFSLVLLCLHSKFTAVKGIIVSLSSIYLTVVLYQIVLLTRL
jgi:hypothetical protein